MKKRPWIILIAVCAAAALLTVPAAARRKTEQLQDYIIWQDRTLNTDLTGDGKGEILCLADKKLSIRDQNGELFRSGQDWKVQNILAEDIDGDGRREAVLLVWRKGNYGSSRPFWVDKDEGEDTWSQHIFVYRYDEDRIRPLWMSSDIGLDVKSWRMDDDAVLHLTGKDGSETGWIWGGWGFALIEDPGIKQDGADTGEAESSGKTADAQCLSEITFLAAGDNLIHEGIYAGAKTGRTFDFTPIYANVRERIESADIAAVNQETVLVSDLSQVSGYPEFGTPVSAGDALAETGFDIVACATNHVMDKGEKAVLETIGFWRDRHPQVTVLGIRDKNEAAYRILEKKGIRLALFDYTYGLNGYDPPKDGSVFIDRLKDRERFTEDLKTAEESSDISICFLHFGTEYSREPDEFQISLCEELIDAGADLIIGTHPHVLQPVRKITTAAGNAGVVFYSLGNFAANQPVFETILGAFASVTIAKIRENGSEKTIIRSCELIPTVCHFSKGCTRVFLLDDYTDELARDHYIYREIQKFKTEDLRALYAETVRPKEEFQ